MVCSSVFFTSIVPPDSWSNCVSVNVDLDNLYIFVKINSQTFFYIFMLTYLVYGSYCKKNWYLLNSIITISVKKLVEYGTVCEN